MTETCSCQVVFRPSKGTFDTVTGEWLAEKDTLLVWLDLSEQCEMHPTVKCHGCSALTISRNLTEIEQGWARRVDGEVLSCPEHLDNMPPREG